MQYTELKSLQHDHSPISIEIESLEGGIYIAYVNKNGNKVLISDRASPLKAYSLIDMRDKLEPVNNATFCLVMMTPYDEMIGGHENASGKCAMPLAWGSSAVN